MDKAQEMYTLQKYFGIQEINLILGNFESYKVLRDKHSFQEIYNEIKSLMII
jgi:hypothetical protein